MTTEITPQTALVILLGASEWPEWPELDSSEAFTNSARDVKSYFLKQFYLPEKNLLDLFNEDKSAEDINKAIYQFLTTRIAEMKEDNQPARDVFIYFTGHAGFAPSGVDYFLAVRRTWGGDPDASGLRIVSLARTIKNNASNLRRILVLDCCFAAAAFSAFQGDGLEKAAIEQTVTAFKAAGSHPDTLPTRGTSLLCSSSRSELSLMGDRYTEFSDAFLQVLNSGSVWDVPEMSLKMVAELVREYLDEKGSGAPRPVVHSPDQREGDVAEIPFFPNPCAIKIGQGIPSIFSESDLRQFEQGKYYDIYKKMGAHLRTVRGSSGVNFAVWAPNADRVYVIGDFNQWNRTANPMYLRHKKLGVWECFIPSGSPLQAVEKPPTMGGIPGSGPAERGAVQPIFQLGEVESPLGLRVGSLYKFVVYPRSENDIMIDKTEPKIDPYGFSFELRPGTASIVADISQYKWQDKAWMQQHSQIQHLNSPISIYEVHLGSWRRVHEQHQEKGIEENRWMTYRELAPALAEYAKEMGFTHIEVLPITEHPFDGSWGYQVTGYYAPSSRFGPPEDFQYFVDYLHQQGIGVILDWVPSHFARDKHALSYFDGTHLYEYADPRKGEHKEWGTYVFNYGRKEVRNFLIGSALFWLREYHVDGLRFDAVTSMLYLDYNRPDGEWIRNRLGGSEHLEAAEFIRQLNLAVESLDLGAVTYAEDSSTWPSVTLPALQGGLGFTFKWGMSWMRNMLEYMHQDSIYRRKYHNNLVSSLEYIYSENFILPLSHDEVVHAKGSLIEKMPPDDLWMRFANLRTFYGYMWGHPGKKLLFMGGEFGQWREWNYAESLDWHLLEPPSHTYHSQLRTFVRHLNMLYQREPALSELDDTQDGFSWIDSHNSDNCIVSFMRSSRRMEDTLIFICNFTPVPRVEYRLGVPYAGEYYELINSDDISYGGIGVKNRPSMTSEPGVWQSFPNSLLLTLPPLSTIILKRRVRAMEEGKIQEES